MFEGDFADMCAHANAGPNGCVRHSQTQGASTPIGLCGIFSTLFLLALVGPCGDSLNKLLFYFMLIQRKNFRWFFPPITNYRKFLSQICSL